MPRKVDWSVIIVNYNSSRETAEAVQSFARNHEKVVNFEILIGDNNSDQANREKLSRFCERNKEKYNIKQYFLDRNLGFGGMNNYLAAKTKGQYLLFLNPDTVIVESFLPNVEKVLQEPEIGLVAPILKLSNGKIQAYAYGKFPTLTNTIGGKLKTNQARGDLQSFSSNDEKLIENKPTKSNLMQVDWVSGACFGVRREVFQEVRGFDERFFLYFEDVDLCKRVQKAGYLNFIDMDVSIIHLGGEREEITKSRRAAYFAGQDQYFRIHRPWELTLLQLVRLPYRIWRAGKDAE